jgi:hypothetical protein
MEERIARMANRIAADEDDMPLKNVDEAVDNIIAALIVLDENIPLVETDNVPQRAAIDNVQELLDEAVKPYMADIVQALEIFGA